MSLDGAYVLVQRARKLVEAQDTEAALTVLTLAETELADVPDYPESEYDPDGYNYSRLVQVSTSLLAADGVFDMGDLKLALTDVGALE